MNYQVILQQLNRIVNKIIKEVWLGFSDSSFGKYEHYSMLRDDFHFNRVSIPINLRNSSNAHSDFDSNDTPVCPIDKTPFTYLGKSGEKNRSMRFKWVCTVLI